MVAMDYTCIFTKRFAFKSEYIHLYNASRKPNTESSLCMVFATATPVSLSCIYKQGYMYQHNYEVIV